MLDTRKLQFFTDPQLLIHLANAWEHGQKFSDWSAESLNIIVSDLLTEHIKMCIQKDDSLDKLYATMITMGMKRRHQMLILSMAGKFALFEPDGDQSVKLAFGEMGKTTIPEVFAQCRCIFLPAEDRDPTKAWVKMEDIVGAKGLTVLRKDKSVKEAIADTLSAYCNYFLFLQYVETEVVEVEPKHKFHAKKYEGFKNQQPIKLRVADLGWSRELISKVPSLVTGHLRNQPCGPGRLERKLIFIDPFQRTYHRRSGKDRAIGKP